MTWLMLGMLVRVLRAWCVGEQYAQEVRNVETSTRTRAGPYIIERPFPHSVRHRRHSRYFRVLRWRTRRFRPNAEVIHDQQVTIVAKPTTDSPD